MRYRWNPRSACRTIDGTAFVLLGERGQGFAEVASALLAARAGAAKGTLYLYFPSKEALIDAIVDAGLGLPPRPSPDARAWRDDVAQWMRAKRAMLCARRGESW